MSFSASIARWASSSGICAKPYPLDFLVVRSSLTNKLKTLPCCSKRSIIVFVVVSNDRFPKYTRVASSYDTLVLLVPSGFGCLTVSLRPWKKSPLSELIADVASSSELKVTNPNPRSFPSLSRARNTSETVPNSEKSSFTSSLDTPYGRLPTYILFSTAGRSRFFFFGSSSLGKDNFTLIVLPPTSRPFSSSIAFSISSFEFMSMNANPLASFVSLFLGTDNVFTVPHSANISSSSLSSNS
mmetsp:Transcript_10617/g.15625  ORF Transcript_10617/g.15625 Transcript_10617/m.15625 type:complete len:241 (+) Transcript_10617:1293-2015(+)